MLAFRVKLQLGLLLPAQGPVVQPVNPPISTEAKSVTVVPVGNSLRDYLSARDEDINVITEAATTPETFIPGCTIRFTVRWTRGFIS